MRTIREACFILLVAGLAALATWWVKGSPERLFRCDPATLLPYELCLKDVPMDSPLTWVDARSRQEWMANGLEGSILWNLDESEDQQLFEVEAATRILENPNVVVYCGSENCGLSKQVAARIEALQLGANVKVLKGGWRALRDAKLVGPQKRRGK